MSNKSNYFIATSAAPDPLTQDALRFERIDADLYVEWGTGWDFTAGGKAIFGTSTFFDGVSTTSATGVVEFEGFLQRPLSKSEHDALSLRIAGAKPTRFQSGARPDLASDGVDAEVRVLYGRDLILRPFKVFATAETGYRRRFGPGADQIRADALIGLERGRNLLLVEALTTKSVGAAQAGGTRYDLVRLQATAVRRLGKRTSLQVGVGREAAGRGVLRGGGVFVGFWAEF